LARGDRRLETGADALAADLDRQHAVVVRRGIVQGQSAALGIGGQCALLCCVAIIEGPLCGSSARHYPGLPKNSRSRGKNSRRPRRKFPHPRAREFRCDLPELLVNLAQKHEKRRKSAKFPLKFPS
jgi:hypothetical protein